MIKSIYSYRFSLALLTSIVFGSITGYCLGPHAQVLKPLGDAFLNILFTMIVPLIFFGIATAVISVGEVRKLKKIFLSMITVFIAMGAIAAAVMIFAVIVFPPTQHIVLPSIAQPATKVIDLGQEITRMLTVSNIAELCSPDNMLALIFFSILVGLATLMTGEKAKPFAHFLQAGSHVFMTLITLVMYYAPIGFFAFFAVMVGKLGPALFHAYFRAIVVYYGVAIIYFFVAFTFFAYVAGRRRSVSLFWKEIMLPATTAFATCSSAACIPVNLQSTMNMRVPAEIAETVIPIGTVLNKQGSVLGGVVKIAFLFGLFHMSFLSPFVLLSVLVVAILVGTVMGAIPSGGMLGEMLILSWYGFPPQSLLIIATISILIDPIATMLNVTGNTVASLLIARLQRL